MANKKINELSSRTPSLTDLTLVGDPTNGYSYQCTLSALQGLFFNVQVTTVFGRSGNVVAAEGDYTLTQLGDVTITTPAANEVLVYNGTAWVNGNAPNIYSVNGTLTGNRTVTMGSTTLSFIGPSSRNSLVINQWGNVGMGGTGDSISALIVTGRSTITQRLAVGSNSSDAGHVQGLGNSVIFSGANFGIGSAIPSNSQFFGNLTLNSLTGTSNIILGEFSGSELTTSTANLIIGRTIGRGITTGSDNVIIGNGGPATNMPADTNNIIHIIGGRGYYNGDASTIPNSVHCFIGGGRTNSTNFMRDYYWGVAPFSAISAANGITFYAPSGSGTNIGGGSYTIAGGRGTGTGTPGDVIISTSTTGTTGTTLQTLTGRMWIKGNTGRVGIGTSSPTVALDVVGDINMTGSMTMNGITNNGQNSLISYGTNFADGEFGTYAFRQYTPTTTRNNLNSYGLINSVIYDLRTASYTGSATYNAAVEYCQLSIAGNATTKATQPFRLFQAVLVGNPGTAAMNLSQIRFLDIKQPDAAGISGHVVDDMFGLRIAQMKGTTNFTITNGWGIYQEGSTDNNYFNGKVLIGTATPGGSPLRISGLPTSATGLSTGDLWNDSGTIKIA